MIPFQGRSTIKQYLPLKPIKRGIKVWVLADSHNGYFYSFEVYVGKGGGGDNYIPELGLGGSVVHYLTQPLVHKHHHVFMDSFFSSADLYHTLLVDGIYACGTIRPTRKGFPAELRDKKKVNLKKRYEFVHGLSEVSV